ncbi:MAG TPA: hypothetical protein VFT74_21620 [Isosphaeraceae bacterium]|nr:hypothetical protein [Isosphaeraceae bacterium]
MDVSRWGTPATFFPWHHVQQYIDGIDSTVYRVAIEFAQQELLVGAHSCLSCGRPAGELFWLSVSDPEAAWDDGTGRVGFLTLCQRCHLQVDFLVDRELTEMQADQWRDSRTLN